MSQKGRNGSHRGRNVFRGCDTSHRGGEKRLKLGQVITATGAKRLEDWCETSWRGGGAKRLWCEMSWSQTYLRIINSS